MIPRIVLACLLAAVPLAAQQEEKPKVPKDSLLVTVTGCLKGRVIRAEDVRQPDTTSGMTVRNHSFRLAGKKDVMEEVKENDGKRVEISGLIKKSALIESGMKFKGGRVVIGGGSRDQPRAPCRIRPRTSSSSTRRPCSRSAAAADRTDVATAGEKAAAALASVEAFHDTPHHRSRREPHDGHAHPVRESRDDEHLAALPSVIADARHVGRGHHGAPKQVRVGDRRRFGELRSRSVRDTGTTPARRYRSLLPPAPR